MITAKTLASVVIGVVYNAESFDKDCEGFVFENCTFNKCNLTKQFVENNLFIDCKINKQLTDTKLATNQAFVARLQRIAQ